MIRNLMLFSLCLAAVAGCSPAANDGNPPVNEPACNSAPACNPEKEAEVNNATAAIYELEIQGMT